MINGAPGPTLAVNAPKPVPADTLAGAVHGGRNADAATSTSSICAGGRPATNIVARGNCVRSFKSDYAWTHARTPQSKLAVAVDADSVSAMGFAFDTVNARVTYASPGGHVEAGGRARTTNRDSTA